MEVAAGDASARITSALSSTAFASLMARSVVILANAKSSSLSVTILRIG